MKAENLFKKDTRSLYKLAEEYFHRYIRARDGFVCFTCGKRGGIQNAGHFNHGGNNKYAFWCDFDEKNLHSQCYRCNHMLSGNLNVYAEKLIQKYGAKIISKLNGLHWKDKAWGKDDLIKIIEKYRKL